MRIILFCTVFLWSMLAYSGELGVDRHPLYLGVNGGYGSTTWKGLVPTIDNQSIALKISTPTDVREGGGVWGGVVGFDFTHFFGIEANYLVYPKAEVFFDDSSLFAFENGGQIQLSTSTQTASLMAKIMLSIPNTLTRAYSSVGVGWIHRKDSINNIWFSAPSFGVGLNYPLAEHLMAELAANYMSGYGESELNPANDFVPFLYAVYFRLAYRV
ncbi:MAG: outer membrane beta-barrel protein [Gammaproteobacteria bacterium]|nr:outer membrane beta-barrel protein [Gammaproteobacteria bacterium]